jgi:hypothetical protein
VRESAARVAAFKALSSLPLPALDRLEVLGAPAHQALAASFPRVDVAGPVGSPVGD